MVKIGKHTYFTQLNSDELYKTILGMIPNARNPKTLIPDCYQQLQTIELVLTRREVGRRANTA